MGQREAALASANERRYQTFPYTSALSIERAALGEMRGVAVMNIVFMGGAAAIQGLSAVFVRDPGGLGPDALYGRLFLAYGLALLAATAIYAFAPREPVFGPTGTAPPVTVLTETVCCGIAGLPDSVADASLRAVMVAGAAGG